MSKTTDFKAVEVCVWLEVKGSWGYSNDLSAAIGI